jgi:hypothetical protein
MTTPEHERRLPEPEGRPDETRGPVHEFAGGEIESYTGRVNLWLVVLYVLLALWAIYYLVVYWGGLGPGLEGPR